jgi:cystathionine beta-synthase
MTREIALKEGIFAGNSSGAVVAGLLQLKEQLTENDLVVVIIHDHGTRYIGKMYNEDWLRERGFLKDEKVTARTILSNRERQEMVTIDASKTVLEAMGKLKSLNISQLPVTRSQMIVGKITENDIYSCLFEDPAIKTKPIAEIMTQPFPIVDLDTSIDKLSSLINKENTAVMVVDDYNKLEIITQFDIINAISV